MHELLSMKHHVKFMNSHVEMPSASKDCSNHVFVIAPQNCSSISKPTNERGPFYTPGLFLTCTHLLITITSTTGTSTFSCLQAILIWGKPAPLPTNVYSRQVLIHHCMPCSTVLRLSSVLHQRNVQGCSEQTHLEKLDLPCIA